MTAQTGPGRARRFHDLHHASVPLLLPNAWDYASTAALAAAGFAAVGTTSLGVAAAAGRPDAAGLTRGETLALAAAVSGLCLLTVDVEGGFADDPTEVGELAAALAEAGAVGVNIEDGRPDGTLRDVRHQCDLVAAIRDRAPDLFVNARTDTYWLSTPDAEVAATLRRLSAYVDAGAHGVFVPGVRDLAEVGEIATGCPVPLNVLFDPRGPSVAELAAAGARRVSLGSLLFRTALGAALDAAEAVRDGRPVTHPCPSYRDVQALLPGPDTPPP